MKNEQKVRFADLSKEELEKLEQLEQEMGYTLIAYETNSSSMKHEEGTSL